MININYKMIAESPLYTGSDSSLGIKSELRKQRVKMTKPITISSKFSDEQQREDALVDILYILYNHIDPDYRMKRAREIWGEFKSRILSAASSKGKDTFLTRFANSFGIDSYDIQLYERLQMFDHHEFLYLIRDKIDYLIMRVRYNRDLKNENFKRIKELEKEGKKIQNILDLEEGNMFAGDEIDKALEQQQRIIEEIKSLEESETGLCFNIEDMKESENKLIYKKEFHQTPYFTGNGITGILRRLVMADYLTRIGVTQTFDFAYHTLFTGGVLKVDTKDKVLESARDILNVSLEKLKLNASEMKKNIQAGSDGGEVDIDKIDELTFICPPLRLFGSAIGNTMIESEMIVSNANLICEENNNGEASVWGLIEDVFFTRKDSAKGERDFEIVYATEDTHQMKYIMETVIKGAEFTHSFICKSNNELVKAAFYNTLDLFVNYPYIGGKSSRGLGNVNLEELKKQIDYDYVEKYRQHLEDNKEQMRRFFSVG